MVVVVFGGMAFWREGIMAGSLSRGYQNPDSDFPAKTKKHISPKIEPNLYTRDHIYQPALSDNAHANQGPYIDRRYPCTVGLDANKGWPEKEFTFTLLVL